MKQSSTIYYLKYIVALGLFLLLGHYSPLMAQGKGMIQTKVESKARRVVYSKINEVKTGATMKAKGSKRALKSSLKGGRPEFGYNTDPTLDELIDDPDVKSDLSDNSNRSRYVELFGEWTTMKSDAQILAEAKLKAYRDSINAIERTGFRVTKNVWDDSRPMIIFGWHPHWMGEMYKSYDYGLFNVVSYYSYDINPDHGGPQDPAIMANFLASDFVKTAHEKGVSALLSITCHGEHNVTRFLSQNPNAQQSFTDSLLYILDSVNADGIEINFEGVNAATKEDFFKFIRILSTTVTGLRGDTSFVFLSVPTYDPENIYDIGKLQNFVDIFIVKGFNFHQTPDELKKMPPAPLNSSTLSSAPDLRTAVNKYLANVGPLYSDRLVLALPYFGTMWVTDGVTEEIIEMNSITYGDIQFDFVMQQDNWQRFPKAKMDYDDSKNAYVFSYKDYRGIDTLRGGRGRDVTIYYDDTLSLRRKYQYLIDARLGGVGLQFLGNDSGFDHLEQLLSDEFTEIILPEEDLFADVNEKSSTTRQNAIYILAVLLYLSIFMAIGFCAALFHRETRQALFESGRFRLLYMAFFTLLMLLLGGYLGLFQGASFPLLVGVIFGSVMSWVGWKSLTKKKSLTP